MIRLRASAFPCHTDYTCVRPTEAQRHRANQMYLCVSVSLCVVGTRSQWLSSPGECRPLTDRCPRIAEARSRGAC